MMSTAAPGAFELVAWYAEMGVTEALDESPHDHFAAPPAVQPEVPRPRLPARQQPGTAAAPATRAATAAATAPDDAALSALALAQAATTLEDLREALARFEGCALKATAKNLVFADGNPAGRVMLIGEAPGADEDRLGLPFAGRSGQLLDRMLAAIGLTRQDHVYIANLLPWRPPGNRKPSASEIAICLPFIQRQIQLARPDFLVCLGPPVAQTLLGAKSLMASRGKWMSYDAGGRQIGALATFHPDYLLDQPVQKRLVWRDLRALRAALDAS